MPVLCASALCKRRHALGITQKELAFYLGLHKADIERLESQDSEISESLLSRLCGTLSCQTSRLTEPSGDALTRADMEAILAFSRLTPKKRRAVAEIILQLSRPC